MPFAGTFFFTPSIDHLNIHALFSVNSGLRVLCRVLPSKILTTCCWITNLFWIRNLFQLQYVHMVIDYYLWNDQDRTQHSGDSFQGFLIYMTTFFCGSAPMSCQVSQLLPHSTLLSHLRFPASLKMKETSSAQSPSPAPSASLAPPLHCPRPHPRHWLIQSSQSYLC